MTETEFEIKPGLSHLNLSINVTNDRETLNYIRHTREMYRNKEPTPNVYNILDCLLAFIDKQFPRGKHQSVIKLETILKNDPNHLNALAELEILYKQLFRKSHANDCRAKIKYILAMNDKLFTRQKAICLLEQGYSLLFEEEEICVVGIASAKSQELCNLIDIEYQKKNNNRKHILKETLSHSKNISMKLERLKHFPKEHGEIKHKLETAIKFLDQGLELLKSCPVEETEIERKETEIAEWQYYLAMAHHRCEKWSSDTKHLSVRIFIEVLSVLERVESTDCTRFYIGRCYAYIGYIYSSKQSIVMNYKENLTLDQKTKYNHILSKPELAIKVALEMSPCDINILNRYAMFLYQQAKRSYSLNDLQTAENYLNKSIELSPEYNWLAYSTRISLLLFWSRNLGIDENDTIKSFLQRAVNDGNKCFETKITEKNCIDVAKACQILAKHPTNGRHYGPEYVTNRDYLYEALKFLHHALDLQGATNYSTVWTLGTCLYELQDYREAIEWMKRAMYLSNRTKIVSSLTNVCLYICEYYKQLAEPSKNRYLLEEMLFVLRHAVDKTMSKNLIENVYKTLQQEIVFVDFIEFIFDSTYRRNPAHLNLAKRIAQLIGPDGHTQMLERISSIEKSNENADCDNFKPENLEEIFQRSLTFVPNIEETDSVPGDEYKYDFFVSHSSNDSGWVKTFLLRHLEMSFGDKDRKLRGCIDERDFVPGETIIGNIIKAIMNSKRVILVLSPSFVKSNWCSYELDQSLMHQINERGNKQDIFLIPLIIETCDIPSKLTHLTYEDLTDNSKVMGKLDRVKRLLMDF